MNARITGVSTPFGGVTWEYKDRKEQDSMFRFSLESKIKAFISSKCGDNGKYDKIRKEIKDCLEKSGLIDVYCFGLDEASTLTAYEEYSLRLKDSDVCVFLIDNADGVSDGVLKEFEIVQKYNIKSLYYFCNGSKKEETFIEKKVKESDLAKSSTVSKFEALSLHGAQGLINDIIFIYHSYCKNWVEINDSKDKKSGSFNSFLSEETLKDPQLPKSILKNLDKCKQFLLETVGFSYGKQNNEVESVNKIDEWGRNFLSVLFEKETIKNFNCSLFLEGIKDNQDANYHRVVCKRWEAIQKYFMGDVNACIQSMKEALKIAKDTNLPSWLVQDILIDIRNQNINLDTINNCFSESEAQKELNENKEAVYYPLLDRFYQSLEEKYIKGIFKETTKEPNSVTYGVSYNEYGDLFASSLIVSMFNGSLTHILLIYDKLFDFLFYLSYVNDTWIFKRELLKFAIYLNDRNKINGILRTFPEILANISEEDALIIMEFSDNNPIDYQRFKSQMLAFGTVGYYLSNDVFEKYEILIINEIEEWADNEKKVIDVGSQIFDCLYKVRYRISQDKLAYICMSFMEKHFRYWYSDLFKFITRAIDLNRMSEDCKNDFVRQIINLLDDEEDKKIIEHGDKTFLYVLRNQDLLQTKELDDKIKKAFPKFYDGSYRLETTENPQRDFQLFIEQFINDLNKRNVFQRGNEKFTINSTDNITTIRAILLDNNFQCPADLMDSIISTISDTLFLSKESIFTKLDAISLLSCITLKFNKDYERNKAIFERIIKMSDEITDIKNMQYDANIDKISIDIGISLLQTAMSGDAYEKMLEELAHIHDNVATIRMVTELIVEYLEVDDSIMFPKNVEVIVLQNVLQWLDFKDNTIRYNSTKILLYLLRNPQNKGIVNQKIEELVDFSSSLIKELILQQINETPNINSDTRDYVILQCKKNANYVVREMSKA